ncbi:MAG TPA: carboxypeptidase-like regulatory domain-containing protein [Mucilaginibacter sp.]|jgi:hypothetical protein|nr:carboxypeptidase-like regulatory domain-containing protein [Mucilaginibacter sp.]
MYNIKSISIPTPCHQSWQQMETRGNGRHCAHCSKIVVDFSKMTNDEILAYLSGTSNVCGRFSQIQLMGINDQLSVREPTKTYRWKRWLIAASLFSSGLISKAYAQTMPSAGWTIQQAPADSARIKIAPADSSGIKPMIYHVSGDVIGSDDKLPVVGATVRIKGTAIGAVTDVQGHFQFAVQKLKAVLVISYIGYETKEVKVSFEKTSDLNITLKLSPSFSGLLEITPRQPSSRVEMFYQYMSWPINRLFK